LFDFTSALQQPLTRHRPAPAQKVAGLGPGMQLAPAGYDLNAPGFSL
jgi:hypothetical protein